MASTKTVSKAKAPTAPKKKAKAPAKTKKEAKIIEPLGDDPQDEDGDAAAPVAKRGNGKGQGKTLVIVESPAKAKTIKKYLGKGFSVKASVGHVKDLPKSRLGVDVEKGFEPEYVVMTEKKKVISELRKSAEEVELVYLAPDPDREG